MKTVVVLDPAIKRSLSNNGETKVDEKRSKIALAILRDICIIDGGDHACLESGCIRAF